MPAPLAAIPPISTALRAYGAAPTAGADFGAMVGQAARNTLATLRTAEVTTARGVAGTADVQEVVQAAANAELTVQTVTQLRDRMVSAYTDVLRMAV